MYTGGNAGRLMRVASLLEQPAAAKLLRISSSSSVYAYRDGRIFDFTTHTQQHEQQQHSALQPEPSTQIVASSFYASRPFSSCCCYAAAGAAATAEQQQRRAATAVANDGSDPATMSRVLRLSPLVSEKGHGHNQTLFVVSLFRFFLFRKSSGHQ